jgi:hypothetical protein
MSASIAANANAAPVLELTSKPNPGKFAIGGSHKIDLLVRNTGDATIPGGSTTITETLPPELTATGYTSDIDFLFFSPNWTCAISDGGHTVTCTGPLAFGFGIAPGTSTSVSIDVDVAPGVADGSVVEHQAQVCGGGAASCASDSDAILVQTNKLRVTDSAGALPGPRAWFAGTCDLLDADNVVAGTAADTPASPRDCIDFGTYQSVNNPNRPTPWATPPSWRLAPSAEAGGHPDATAAFLFDVQVNQGQLDAPNGNARNILVDVPPGVIGDPRSVAKCTQQQFAASPHQCPPEAQVGVSTLRLLTMGSATGNVNEVHPVYNLAPRKSYTAEFGIPDIAVIDDNGTGVSVRIFAEARTDGDFGVSTGVMSVPTQFPLIAQSLTFWGVPWAASHDRWRPASSEVIITDTGIPNPADRAGFDDWGSIKPFFTNPTECAPQAPVTFMAFDAYENPAPLLGPHKPDLGDPRWTREASEAAVVSECQAPPFAPDLDLQPTSSVADSATGLVADLTLPPNDTPPADVATNPDDATGAPLHWKSPEGRGTAQLDKAVVELPEGMTINPSAAAGLEACSDAQIGVEELGNPPRFNNGDPFDGVGPVECPQSSIIGTVEATTPVLDEKLTGQMVLGAPKSTDPMSGEMFRTFLVLRNEERGLLAKVYGSSTADPATGQITALFDRNPRVPVDNIKVQVKGGERALLANPLSCGQKTTNSVFTPWTAAHNAGGIPKTVEDGFVVAGDCSQGFAPTLQAGMNTNKARANGTFSFRFTRPQGDQTLRGLTAKLPTGLLASVKGLPLCKDANAAAGTCPAGSKIGIVDAAAGSGDPFILEEKGEVFLTEGYKGGEYGLAVKVRAIAGPFRGAMELSPIIVRQAIHVDRKTAQVTAISDDFPQVWHGVPLRVREVTVLVNRDKFMLNPSDCEAKTVDASIVSAEGTVADRSVPFQASGCAALPFKPKLTMRLTGRKQVRTGKHPGIKAQVTQKGIGEAGIEKAEVRLPKSLALDPDNAQALCEFADGTKPDLENHCPKGSIVGRSRATSPLLNDPLVGNVYFVKNIRKDAKTGNEIRTLPMIIVALRGEIAINLKGESDTTKDGKLVNTFNGVPDAPVSKFNLNIKGGSKGILAVTRTRRSLINLCSAGRQIAEADMDGQNGKRHDFNVNMRKPCPKRRRSAAAVCRTRTNTKPAFRRCVRKVKANRAKAAKRKAAAKRKQAAAKRRNARG